MLDTVTGSLFKPNVIEDTTVKGSVDGSGSSKVSTKGDKAIFEATKDELGKQEFLNLLITSLRYQDPLNPQSNEQFISQMAEFSGLEAAQNTNKSIETLSGNLEKLITHQQNAANTMAGASSTGLLGKNVRIGYGDFNYFGGPVEYNVHVDKGEAGFLSVVNDKDEVVNVVPILDLDGKAQNGDFMKASWNGMMADGKSAPVGKYHFEVTTSDGSRDVGYSFIEGAVSGLTYTPEGTMLTVNGQEKKFEDIIHVSNILVDINK